MDNDKIQEMAHVIAATTARYQSMIALRHILARILGIGREIKLTADGLRNGFYPSVVELESRSPDAYRQYKEFRLLCMDVFYQLTTPYALFPKNLSMEKLEATSSVFQEMAPFTLSTFGSTDWGTTEKVVLALVRAIDDSLMDALPTDSHSASKAL